MSVADNRRIAAAAVMQSGAVPSAAPIVAVASRRRHWKVVRLLVLSDILTVLVSMVVSVAAIDPSNPWPPFGWTAVTLTLTLILFSSQELYERDRRQISVSSLDEVRDVLTALGLVGFATFAAALALHQPWILPREPLSVVFYWLAGILLVTVGRAALRQRVIPNVSDPERTVVVGAGKVGQSIVRKIRRNRQYNVEVIGFLDDDPATLDADVADVPILGSERDLLDTIIALGVTRVVLAFSRSTHEDVLELVRTAGLRDVHISIVPRYFEIIAANVGIADVEGISVLELPVAGLSHLALVTKRAFDLCLTVPALIVLWPLLLIVAIAIRLDSPGPVFYRQARMGRDDEPFEIVKFRTMVDGAEQMRSSLIDENESSGPLFKIRQDPRVTRVGRMLRRFSIDELPQLFNVVSGKMSLVGPRPFVIYEDDKIAGWARRRLELTPGITGLWQVLGRNDIEYDEMVKLDYLYVTNWSLWWDMKLILRTIPIVLGRRGY
jgi:exopolysaccharide biosynthesis polyprenyl glycosylphosphotransferase